ncbi:MAG: ATP synthase F1 subunit gamma [Lachnospiraceae bacterium]|nr:ATP synthase F1 subunit gamma [Lachnospiraceae bacterium]
MESAKEIKDRMKSIQDTMKITSAMYMISSSKLKKAKKSLQDTEPYFYMLQSTMSRILRHLPEMHSPYFTEKEEYFTGKEESRKQTKAFIVVTADKGMAGAYNHNVMKLAHEQLRKEESTRLYVLGELGRHYFEQQGISIDRQFHYTVQNPSLGRARKIAENILEDYLNHEVDEVYMIYTKMINSMQTETQLEQLLPLKRADFNNFNSMRLPLNIPMEELALKPSPEAVMDRIVPEYLVGFIYGALVESYSSEQNSRLMAMEAATDSASKILHELDVRYNRARQAAITQEITEVIGGARAQKKKKK